MRNHQVLKCWHLLIFPGSCPPSIFSASELNFCVRNGNRWTLTAINTNYFVALIGQQKDYIIRYYICQHFFTIFLKLKSSACSSASERASSAGKSTRKPAGAFAEARTSAEASEKASARSAAEEYYRVFPEYQHYYRNNRN